MYPAALIARHPEPADQGSQLAAGAIILAQSACRTSFPGNPAVRSRPRGALIPSGAALVAAYPSLRKNCMRSEPPGRPARENRPGASHHPTLGLEP